SLYAPVRHVRRQACLPPHRPVRRGLEDFVALHKMSAETARRWCISAGTRRWKHRFGPLCPILAALARRMSCVKTQPDA
ncbi:hypothetical protein OFN63_31630, partial [Escherichia coli]|nr:hypothetical protein [Escherichia coli]